MTKALDQIKAGKNSRKVRLVLAEGEYDFYPQDCSKKEYFISNHDQDNPKHVAIAMEGFKKFTLDGAGASIYTHGRMLPVSMVNYENSTLKNIPIDSRTPQIFQATILENDNEKGEITYQLADDVNYRIDNGKTRDLWHRMGNYSQLGHRF